jgi:hypothetical protein
MHIHIFKNYRIKYWEDLEITIMYDTEFKKPITRFYDGEDYYLFKVRGKLKKETAQDIYSLWHNQREKGKTDGRNEIRKKITDILSPEDEY